MDSNVAVVIPIYCTDISEKEKISLRQAKNIFRNRQIYFIAPEGLKFEGAMDEYTEGIEYEYFSASAFESIQSYNKLMLSISLYKRFQRFEYILIHQLDAFVFCDNLNFFCNMQFDYIGAPWLEGILSFRGSKPVICHVGNGGLSLRKVESFVRLLESKQEELLQYKENEDFVFSVQNSDNFRVASENVALQFSFERNVRQCYGLNENRLPFGCHAWWTYDLEFWKKYIENFGYKIDDEWVKSGNKDLALEEKYREIKRENLLWKEIFENNNVKIVLENFFGQEEKEYIIYGAGIWGKRLAKALRAHEIKIKCLCDSDKGKIGQSYEGIMIESIEDILSWRKKEKFIVAVKHGSDEIIRRLQKAGLEHNHDFIVFRDIREKMHEFMSAD